MAIQDLLPKATKTNILANIDRILQPTTDFIRGNPIVSTASIGAGVTGLVAGAAVVAKKRKKTTKKKSTKKKTHKGRSRDRKYISKQKHEQAYVRRKRRAGKKITRPRYKTKKRTGGVYYTKKGQPYKIMANGRARFIKGKRRKS